MKKLLILAVLTVCFSCSKEKKTEKPVEFGYAYYPLQVNDTWLYEVDSFAYSDNSQTDTVDEFHFQLKQVISGTFTNESGTIYIIERFARDSDSADWVSRPTYFANISNNRLELAEENLRFVKLLFPVNKDVSWDGNMFNSLGKQNYMIEAEIEQFSLRGREFGNAIKVLEEEEHNAIEEILKYSVYAKNIGLVEYALTDLNTQVSGTNGLKYHIYLRSYTHG